MSGARELGDSVNRTELVMKVLNILIPAFRLAPCKATNISRLFNVPQFNCGLFIGSDRFFYINVRARRHCKRGRFYV